MSEQSGWQFDAQKYLDSLPKSDLPEPSQKEREFFEAMFKSAAQPIDRGRMWKLCAEKSGMTVEELWFDMNRTNAAMGCAPFYGGDAEGFVEFMALQGSTTG